jgi:phasin family protein
MNAVSPKLIDAVKANTNALLMLSKATFSSIERLAALNLSTAAEVLEERIAATEALVQIKDVKDLKNMPISFTEPVADKALAYFRNVQEIVSDAQAELSKFTSHYYQTLFMGVGAGAGQTLGLDMFKKLADQMTRQVTDVTEANLQVIGDTSALMAAPAIHSTRHSK